MVEMQLHTIYCKILFILIAMLMGSYIAFSQLEPGTVVKNGGAANKNPITNGLTQLYSVSGAYTLSADGAGSGSSNYTIDVNKPNAGATVHKAFLMCAPVWANSGNCTQLNGQSIAWGGSSPAAWGCCNYYADVTAIVAPVINPAGVGITTIPLYECDYIDGYALLVIFSDPLAFPKTIVIMFGGLSTTGDNFSITLGEPIDPNVPGALLNMGLGISYSYQGSGQYSIVDINGQRLTTSAGGQDDGGEFDGGLITVGGIGDVNTNPPDPNAIPANTRSDDELYSLLPFITNTTTNILVNTSNPSNNDNVFLSYFEISGVAIIGEGIILSQTTSSGTIGSTHTVKAHVVDGVGAPVPGKLVNFTVQSGPNAGTNGSATTDAGGNALFTYTGAGGPGFDNILACTSPAPIICSNTLSFEWTTGLATIPTLSEWGLIFLGLSLLAFGTFYILKMRG